MHFVLSWVTVIGIKVKFHTYMLTPRWENVGYITSIKLLILVYDNYILLTLWDIYIRSLLWVIILGDLHIWLSAYKQYIMSLKYKAHHPPCFFCLLDWVEYSLDFYLTTCVVQHLRYSIFLASWMFPFWNLWFHSMLSAITMTWWYHLL